MVDPRGMGQSARPTDIEQYGIGERAADVLAIADELGFSQFAFWGGSLGGAVGLVLAAEQPQRLVALVLSGQWLRSPSDRRTGLAEIAASIRQGGDPGALVREMCDAEGVPASHWIRSVDHGDAEVVAALTEGGARIRLGRSRGAAPARGSDT
jgi:pimeloyl-ACP methyl ester carboxylesterase